ncbi:MAG: efflux transporter outer membrane subunit [Rhodobacteraceae bacterium]|nr:efflux transporter outer membrane subunit [Paracoccaceae bacterium]
MQRQIISGYLALALVGCSVGPDYKAPMISLSERFEGGSSTEIGQVNQRRWWRDLNDRQLDILVERGLSRNLSLQSALAAVRVAQGRLAASGAANQQNSSLSASQTRQEPKIGPATTMQSATVNATYVLDLFGGLHRGQQQARAGLQAAEYDVGTARLAYLSTLVGTYIDMRYAQESLELTRQAIKSQQELRKIVQDEFDVGAVAELQVAQAQAALDQVIAQLPDLESKFEASVFGIATLLAEPAGPLLKTLQRGAPQPLARTRPAIGVPAELLRNRPDILAAERSYAAAIAGVGVSEAALYPSLALSGTISTSTAANTFAFGPAFSLPIFNQQSLRGNRQAAIATAEQAEIAWRSTVLSAAQDVQTAQSALSASMRQVARLRAVVDSNRRVLELTKSAYEQGASPLTDFINATQSVTQSRMALAGALQQAASNWLSLQVASGSGWAVER